MLRARLAVAAVGLPLLIGLLALPEPLFGPLVAALLALAAVELLRATAPRLGVRPALAAATVVALICATARSIEAFDLWLLLLPLAVTVAFVLQRPWGDRVVPPIAWWTLAVLYFGALGGHWLLLRNVSDDGVFLLVLLLATVFATDTGAYAVGRLTGRHRLWPAVSPGKTWEGAAGGLMAGVAAAMISLAVYQDGSFEPLDFTIAAALGLPIAAMSGDLLESAIKRRAGVKDMSGLLPGHGGLADRMDSLLLAGPLLYWLVRWLT